jgi:HK97 family phage prohead protease
MAKYDHIDFSPPDGVQKEAARALEWRRKFGRGGTGVGVARARTLSNGSNITPSTARRMHSYFSRHVKDKSAKGFSPGEDGFPSAGRIAWGLWGGDAGEAWSGKLVSQMDAADKRSRPMPNRTLSVVMADLRSAVESRVFCSTGAGRRRGSGRSSAPAVESRSISVERRSVAVVADGEGEPLLRIESRCECQDNGEETKREYIVGYAAKFGVNSLDLGKFTERIAPTAFRLVTERRGRKKSLDTRALFNHNADLPLAKHPGTLKLSVDDVGLRYEFPVPDTSYGRDLAANIRSGIVTGSSFSFTVPKDGEEWTMEEGRSIRTVTRVDSLIDVGPVTYPAYPDTDAAVAQRSYDEFMSRVATKVATPNRMAARVSGIARRARRDIQAYLKKHGR